MGDSEWLWSSSGATLELYRGKIKPLRKSQSWICSIGYLKSKRHWNVQRHIDRQHSGSYAVPLDAVTMETRDEKYRKHIIESDRLGRDISNYFRRGGLPGISTSRPTFNHVPVGEMENSLPSWPHIAFKDASYLDGLKILRSIYKLFDYPTTSIQQILSDFYWGLAATPIMDYEKPRATTHMICQPRFTFPLSRSSIPCLCPCPYSTNIVAWNRNNSYGLTEMKIFDYPNFSQSDTWLEDDRLLFGYQVNTCRRCFTTDYSVIRFQYDGAKGMIDPTESPRRGSFSYQKDHLCDEEYFRDEICSQDPQEIEDFENSIEIEKNSGQFLFKAISSGSWIEKTKSLVALKIPPIVPCDERIHALINCQIRSSVVNTSNTNAVSYQQPSSSPVPISTAINLQDIPLIEATNQPIFHAAIKEGSIKLDDRMLTTFCECARESSIVIVSVNNVALGCHTNEYKQSTQYSPADDNCYNIEEDIDDAYIEAALGRKMFLLILTPYPEQYMGSSVVLF